MLISRRHQNKLWPKWSSTSITIKPTWRSNIFWVLPLSSWFYHVLHLEMSFIDILKDATIAWQPVFYLFKKFHVTCFAAVTIYLVHSYFKCIIWDDLSPPWPCHFLLSEMTHSRRGSVDRSRRLAGWAVSTDLVSWVKLVRNWERKDKVRTNVLLYVDPKMINTPVYCVHNALLESTFRAVRSVKL